MYMYQYSRSMVYIHICTDSFTFILWFQIRCYPKNTKLDNTFAVITKVPSQILLLNTFRDILIIFCIDSHIMLFNMERKNSQKSKMA